MANNLAVTPGTGATIATNEIGGVHHQRFKLSLGAEGTAVDAKAGAGAVDTGTQRTTLASDDPAVTALQIMDDWDESDRAKVNLIVGQAGIAAGAGPVGATVPRVTLASDDPAVAALGATSGAAVITDASGTIQQYLRGLVKLFITSGSALVSAAGTAAHDAAVSGNPVRTGARARTSNVTAVANDDAVDAVATLVGARITKPYSIPEADWSYAAGSAGILNTTTAVTIAAAAGAGLRNYVTWIDIMAEALGTATEVAIRDGAGGTVLWRTKISTAGLVAGRSIQLPSPIKSTANTLLEVVTITATGSGAVYFNCGGYIAP